MSVQGRTELVRGKPRAALDSLFAMWLAVSSLVEAEVDAEDAASESGGGAGKGKQASREVREGRGLVGEGGYGVMLS